MSYWNFQVYLFIIIPSHSSLYCRRGGDSRSIKTCWSMFRTTLDMKLTSVVIEQRSEFVNTREILL